KLAAQFNTRQLELQTQVAHQQLKNASVVVTPSTTAVIEPPKLSKIDGLTKAATVVGINTQCLRVDIAPSYERLIFSVKTEDFNLLPKFKAASKLALGISEKEDLPFYIYAPEQIAVEVPLPP